MKDKLQVNTTFFESVIACQSLTNSYYTSLILDHLVLDNFKLPGNKLVIGIVKDFYLNRHQLPTITEIKTYLKKDEDIKLFKETLTTYKNIDLNGNIDELISNTELFFKERTVYNTVRDVVNDFTNDQVDYSNFFRKIEHACNIKLINDIGLDFFGDYEKVLRELGAFNEVLPTGWKFLDDKIGGGLLKKGRALYLFLGPTNVGKSIFLGNIASNYAARGLTTVLITLEMPEMVYAKRISSHLSKIPVGDIQTQIKPLESYFKSVVDKHRRKLIIKEFPPKSITVSDIRAYVETLIKNGINPEVLVIDYLGLLKASSGDNSYEHGKVTAEEVRALTYYFNIPVVSAVQTNREGMENPTLDTISESLGVAFTADVVWSIYQDEGDLELGIIKVRNIKNRLGPKAHGETAMRIDYNTLSLSEEKDYIGLASNKHTAADEVSALESKLEKLASQPK